MRLLVSTSSVLAAASRSALMYLLRYSSSAMAWVRVANAVLCKFLMSCSTRLASAFTGLRLSFRNAVVSFGVTASDRSVRVALPSSGLTRSAQRLSSVGFAGCADALVTLTVIIVIARRQRIMVTLQW